MKMIFAAPLILLSSCGLFGGIDYSPAVMNNKAQAASYEELRQAFVAVIVSSPNATQEQKNTALADIEANRVDFYNFSNSLEKFLVSAGSIDPDRLLEITKESIEWIKAHQGGK